MSSTGSDGQPSSQHAGDSSQLSARFRRLWLTGDADLELFLAGEPTFSDRSLASVARIDLRECWRNNRPCSAESYLLRFPRLADDGELALDLIFEEYLAREERGEQPELSEYQRRFPHLAEQLSDQIGFHLAINACDRESVEQSTQKPTPSGSTEPTGDGNSHVLPMQGADYVILQEVGRGSMGVVFKARQVSLNRLVALKMVRATDSGNHDLLARFRAEAKIVARLDHPRIVRIFDFGEHQQLPYLALEWVDGGTLASRLDGRPWPPRDAASIIAKLAQAVEYAHQNHVVHRDLKPSNLLVATDSTPIDIKIADFGLAKIFRDIPASHETKSGMVLGTPSYMAPEQASGHTSGIGPPTDIYALGAILYELLTGRPPYRGETSLETLQQLLTIEPVSIPSLVPHVPRDLTTICEKCLQREPDRRYDSAAALAADLQRFLDDQPILARRTSRLERAWRWCRRNTPLAIALGSVAVLLITIAGVLVWYSGKLSSQLAVTKQAKADAEARLWDAYLAEITARNTSRQKGQRFVALEAADKATALLESESQASSRVEHLRSAVLNSLALPDLRHLRRINSASTDVYMEFTPNNWLVDQTPLGIRLTRISENKARATIPLNGVPSAIDASADASWFLAVVDQKVQAWRIDGAQPTLAWQGLAATSIATTSDGKKLLISDDNAGMSLADLETGTVIRNIGRGAASSSFALHAPSHRLAVFASGAIQVISWDTGETLTEVPLPNDYLLRLAWHPSGQYLAGWSIHDGVITLWDVDAKSKALELRHFGYPCRLQFNENGSRLLSYANWDEHLMLWDVGAAHKLLDVRGFAIGACDTTVSGNILLAKREANSMELWEMEAGIECSPLASALHPALGICHRLSVSSDGRILAVSRNRGLELWDLATFRRLGEMPCGSCMAEFDSAGDLVLACEAGIFLLPRNDQNSADDPSSNSPTSPRIVRFGPPRQLHQQVDGTTLSSGRVNKAMAFRDAVGWAVLHRDGPQSRIVRLNADPDARRGAVSDDGKLVALANWNLGHTVVFDASTGLSVVDLTTNPHADVHFSPDGRWLATTSDGIRLWRTTDWKLERELHAVGILPNGLGFAFSPNGRTVAIGQPDGVLRIIDPDTGIDMARLTHRDLPCASQIFFSPDQERLITLPLDGDLTGWVWNIAAMRPQLAQRGLDWTSGEFRATPKAASHTVPLSITLDDGGLFDGK
ncbi:MAG: serine/threonine-protein kinase [Pirellulales bacterium]